MRLSFLLFLSLAFLYGASELEARTKKKQRRYIVHKKKKNTGGFSVFGRSISSSNEKNENVELVDYSNDSKWREKINDLRANPDVEYVEEDIVLKRASNPNDSLFNQQWALSSMDMTRIWSEFEQSSSLVVAVIDTGVLNHPDISSRLLPGADFVRDLEMANDGDGWDLDPTDPGDWVEFGDSCYFSTGSESSSWHGTHVSGIIAATKDNSLGISGIFDEVSILPVRVLGKCGGLTSDIANAIKWSVGELIPGMPINQNPAKVINLSLGAPGFCGKPMQEAIDLANIRGAVVVVAAGNDNQDLDDVSYTPANCHGVINVGAVTNSEDIASYSNYGSTIDVYAPGGNDWNGILSTHNSGSQSAGSMTYNTLNGTSMAAPHVAGLVAMMMSVNSGLYIGQYENILKETSSFLSDFSKGDGNLLSAYSAVASASVASANSSFRYTPVEAAENGGLVLFKASDESGQGGGCASVNIGSGGGPGGGLFQKVFALALGLVLIGIRFASNRRKRYSFGTAS